jgi:hypothetical protein
VQVLESCGGRQDSGGTVTGWCGGADGLGSPPVTARTVVDIGGEGPRRKAARARVSGSGCLPSPEDRIRLTSSSAYPPVGLHELKIVVIKDSNPCKFQQCQGSTIRRSGATYGACGLIWMVCHSSRMVQVGQAEAPVGLSVLRERKR